MSRTAWLQSSRAPGSRQDRAWPPRPGQPRRGQIKAELSCLEVENEPRRGVEDTEGETNDQGWLGASGTLHRLKIETVQANPVRAEGKRVPLLVV
jgi:hypothetical protein